MSELDRARILTALSLRTVTVEELGEVCLELLPGLDGASVMVIGDSSAHVTVSMAGERGEELPQLQFTLGEGPYLDAHRHGHPELVSDIGATEYLARWPAFAAACIATEVHALFALPLRIGAIRVGVLNLYRDAPGQLAVPELSDLLVFAEAATLMVLDRGLPDGTHKPQLRVNHRVAVHQATGIIMAQLGVSVEEAFVRLRAYTFADGRSLDTVAAEVVARRIRFDVEEES